MKGDIPPRLVYFQWCVFSEEILFCFVVYNHFLLMLMELSVTHKETLRTGSVRREKCNSCT